MKAGDYIEKIIARTRHPQYSREGIEIYNITDWLLQEEENSVQYMVVFKWHEIVKCD